MHPSRLLTLGADRPEYGNIIASLQNVLKTFVCEDEMIIYLRPAAALLIAHTTAETSAAVADMRRFYPEGDEMDLLDRASETLFNRNGPAATARIASEWMRHAASAVSVADGATSPPN